MNMTHALPPTMDEEDVLHELCQGMELLTLDQNTILFLQGQLASSYFIIFSGAVDILQSRDPKALPEITRNYASKLLQPLGSEFSRSKLGNYLCRLEVNKGFGELALIKEGSRRAASALATCPSMVIEVNKDLYSRTLKSYHIDQVNVGKVFELMREHVLFEGLTGRALTQLAYSLQTITFGARVKIGSQGDVIEKAFLICNGEISEQKLQNNMLIQRASKSKGSVIGAVDLLKGSSTYTSSFTTLTAVEGYTIPLEQFSIIMGNKSTVNKFLKLEAVCLELNNQRSNGAKLLKLVKGKKTKSGLNFSNILSHNLRLVSGKEECEIACEKESEKSMNSSCRDHSRCSKDDQVPIQLQRNSTIIALGSDGKDKFSPVKSKSLVGKLSSSDGAIFAEATEPAITIKMFPALKPDPNLKSQGMFSPLNSSPIVPGKAIGKSSLGDHLCHKAVVNAYSNENKPNKSFHEPLDVNELLSDIQELSMQKVPHTGRLSSIHSNELKGDQFARSREISTPKSNNSILKPSQVNQKVMKPRLEPNVYFVGSSDNDGFSSNAEFEGQHDFEMSHANSISSERSRSRSRSKSGFSVESPKTTRSKSGFSVESPKTTRNSTDLRKSVSRKSSRIVNCTVLSEENGTCPLGSPKSFRSTVEPGKISARRLGQEKHSSTQNIDSKNSKPLSLGAFVQGISIGQKEKPHLGKVSCADIRSRAHSSEGLTNTARSTSAALPEKKFQRGVSLGSKLSSFHASSLSEEADSKYTSDHDGAHSSRKLKADQDVCSSSRLPKTKAHSEVKESNQQRFSLHSEAIDQFNSSGYDKLKPAESSKALFTNMLTKHNTLEAKPVPQRLLTKVGSSSWKPSVFSGF